MKQYSLDDGKTWHNGEPVLRCCYSQRVTIRYINYWYCKPDYADYELWKKTILEIAELLNEEINEYNIIPRETSLYYTWG